MSGGHLHLRLHDAILIFQLASTLLPRSYVTEDDQECAIQDLARLSGFWRLVNADGMKRPATQR